jgi:hypothetical protein
MGERRTVAQGQYGDGISWLVWAQREASHDGRPDADLMTMIRVAEAGGRVLREGGAGGPALLPGQLMNVSTGGGGRARTASWSAFIPTSGASRS